MSNDTDLYSGFRHPGEIISHAVWLYHRFALSFRNVEEILRSRGVEVTYESVRQWCLRFGAEYAKRIRVRAGLCGDTWHLDEVFVRINGNQYYLWRAVDQEGDVLDILVQPRRNANAAKRFFRKLLKGHGYSPRVVVTDKLKSYGAAHRDLGMGAAHETDRYRNNRAENSHQPTRQKERQMRGFKSAFHAQRLLSALGLIQDLFRHDRHLMSARSYRELWEKGMEEWNEVAGIVPAI